MGLRIKLEIHEEQDKKEFISQYKIQLIYHHRDFSVHFISPEIFSKAEVDARIMRMAIDLDANTDGIIIANKSRHI